MNKFPVFVDAIHYEIKYEYGNLYFDRCGQCLNDIERNCEGWYMLSTDTKMGFLECPEKYLTCQFNNERFNFSSQKPSKIDISVITSEVNNLWKIIEANLGIDTYLRQGCRIQYLKATENIEDAEKLIKKSEFDFDLPKRISDLGYTSKNLNITTVLSQGVNEYRIVLSGVTRYEAINPTNIIRAEPRFLSTQQNKIRIAKLTQLSEYSANPMFAVTLDIDCYQATPETISAGDFVSEQVAITRSHFVPILER